jgi:UDP-glucose 4-epimerase
MSVVVTGASGNAGTSVLSALADEPAVESVLGVARRAPSLSLPKVEWTRADVSRDALEPLFRGADAVVHLAWLIQPSRDGETLRATNVDGSRRVFEAVAAAGVPALVYASSVGAYSPGPKDRAVDESWPTDGIKTSFYSRHKAEVERLLDVFEAEHPEVRTVRLRPGLIFKRDAASEIRRYFAGPLLPNALMRRIPLVPDTPRLRFQAVHSLDVGDAYRRAVVDDGARGAYNVAAEPVLDPERLASLLGARRVPVPARVLRAAAALTWRARLQPTPEGWVDMALGVPIMDTTRARDELGWEPRFDGGEALLELLGGMADGDGLATPPLHAGGSRLRELREGVGARL